MKKSRPGKEVVAIKQLLEKLVKQGEMEIVITPTNSGAVLKYKPGGVHEVFKFDEDNLEDAVKLFYELRNLMADGGNRYAKQRLEIKIVHGDKHECKDENCEICKEAAH